MLTGSNGVIAVLTSDGAGSRACVVKVLTTRKAVGDSTSRRQQKNVRNTGMVLLWTLRDDENNNGAAGGGMFGRTVECLTSRPR